MTTLDLFLLPVSCEKKNAFPAFLMSRVLKRAFFWNEWEHDRKGRSEGPLSYLFESSLGSDKDAARHLRSPLGPAHRLVRSKADDMETASSTRVRRAPSVNYARLHDGLVGGRQGQPPRMHKRHWIFCRAVKLRARERQQQ